MVEPAGSPVVALVSSAGGLDAMVRVLAPLPPDFPAAVIALQHHRPDSPSMLAQILARRTPLPVSVAADGDELIPGRTLVAPPGRHLLITVERRVVLIMVGATPPYRPSADLLLTTLALAVGPQAVAVVLSGQGTDGATGATAVHRLGGRVIASDAATSTAFSMPSATIRRHQIIDHVVAVDDIAPLLVRLVGRVTSAGTDHAVAGPA
jgi:two-component system, chemotaxis family, protein-glutamate methylesterase/glutaminase